MLDEDNQMKLDLPSRIPKDKEAEVLKQAEASCLKAVRFSSSGRWKRIPDVSIAFPISSKSGSC